MRKVCKVYVNERHIHTRAELTVSFLLVLSCYFVGNHQTQSCMAPFLTLLNFWFRYTFLGGHWTPPRPFIPRSWSFSNKTHFRHYFLLLFFISHPCTNDEKVLFIFDSSQCILHLRKKRSNSILKFQSAIYSTNGNHFIIS